MNWQSSEKEGKEGGRSFINRILKTIKYLFLATQNVIHGPTMLESYGCFLQMQNLRSHQRSTKTESTFKQDTPVIRCTLKFEM